MKFCKSAYSGMMTSHLSKCRQMIFLFGAVVVHARTILSQHPHKTFANH